MSKRKRFHGKGKICRRCKKRKTLKEFGVHSQHGKVGTNGWCKECHREYGHEYKKKPGYKQRNAEYMREYRRRVKESVIK